MASNLEDRIELPLKLVQGPIVGENLLQAFKDEMIKENVFQAMFGREGESIFIDKIPNVNDTILPSLYLAWSSENYMSNDLYMDGFVSGTILFPVKFEGDFNTLRRVGNILQRWMGGAMSLFDKVPGLTRFGYGTDFQYDQLAQVNGQALPRIGLRIPFRFDLQLLTIQTDNGFDPTAPLDDADIGFIESMLVQLKDSDSDTVFVEEKVNGEEA